MGVFHPGEVVTPGDLILGDQALKARLQLLIEAFGLTIGLRMVPGGQADGGAKELAKLWSSI